MVTQRRLAVPMAFAAASSTGIGSTKPGGSWLVATEAPMIVAMSAGMSHTVRVRIIVSRFGGIIGACHGRLRRRRPSAAFTTGRRDDDTTAVTKTHKAHEAHKAGVE